MDSEENINSSLVDNQEQPKDDLATDNNGLIEELDTYGSNINEKSINKDEYEEILKELDITKKEPVETQEKTGKVSKLKENENQSHVEKIIKQDFERIQLLVKNGLINSTQGQNLKQQVLKKAFDNLVQTEKIKRVLLPKLSDSPSRTKNIPKNDSHFDEFNKNNPDFFKSDGRKEVLNYLKLNDFAAGKDELSKISDIVRIVEKSAIDRYLQKTAHEKILINSNENAKQKLTANAQNGSFSGNLSRTFTREQIGKMSGKEFAKYEKAIMEQLKKGQIK